MFVALESALLSTKLSCPLGGEGAPQPGQTLCWGPLSQTPSLLLPKSSRSHRESRAASLGRALALFLSGCVNLDVCLSFLIWKRG